MRLRSRILLIVCGIILFLLLAPAAVFLARGFRYDFGTNRITKTGTLVIKTDPRGAEVYLNSDLQSKTTPLTKRFLLPGDYELEITKSGYFPWKKRINIAKQTVTYLPFSDAKRITLFLETPLKTSLATTSPDISWPDEQQSEEDGPYYVSTTTKTLWLRYPNGTDTELIPDLLPDFTTSKIIATPSREIFLLLDQTLYQVTDRLEKLADSVTHTSWDPETKSFLYSKAHEVWLYFPEAQKSDLVTRSSQNLGQAYYNHTTGYLFVAEERSIKAIEYDEFGQANTYTLVETTSLLPRFKINDEGTELTYLDAGELISVKIR